MKSKEYSELICRGFCGYYKQDKAEMQCGGYAFLRNNLTSCELEHLGRSVKDKGRADKIPPANIELTELVCLKCDFVADGCDFSDNRSGPPCGGYILVKLLFAQVDSL